MCTAPRLTRAKAVSKISVKASNYKEMTTDSLKTAGIILDW
jgi:hypothetical protein